MSLTTIYGLIKAKMEQVPDVGVIHTRMRWSVEWPKFLEHYTTTIDGKRVVRGWSLTRTATSERAVTLGTIGQNDRTHVITGRGFHGLSDADDTETQFQELIEAVCDQFRSTAELAPNVWLGESAAAPTPPQVTTFDERMFGSVLCHYTEIVWTVTERLRRIDYA